MVLLSFQLYIITKKIARRTIGVKNCYFCDQLVAIQQPYISQMVASMQMIAILQLDSSQIIAKYYPNTIYEVAKQQQDSRWLVARFLVNHQFPAIFNLFRSFLYFYTIYCLFFVNLQLPQKMQQILKSSEYHNISNIFKLSSLYHLTFFDRTPTFMPYVKKIHPHNIICHTIYKSFGDTPNVLFSTYFGSSNSLIPYIACLGHPSSFIPYVTYMSHYQSFVPYAKKIKPLVE